MNSPQMSRTTITHILGVSVLAGLAIAPFWPIATLAGIALIAYLPGRALLPHLGISQHWDQPGRAVFSIGVSLATVPFLLNPAWHLTHDRFLMLGYVWLINVLLILFQPRHATECPPTPFFEHRRTRCLAGFILFIIVLGTVFPYWPTELFGYPLPCGIHDHIKHHAMLHSMEQRHLPIGNIFYAPGADTPVHYYHFFYLVPATVRLFTNHALDLELAFGLGSALVGIAFAGMTYAFAKRFSGSEANATLAAVLVTLVGGLDIIPLVNHMIERGVLIIIQDAWAAQHYRLHNFLNQMVWAPQNLIGMLVVVLGVYQLSARGPWRGWYVFGPIWGAAMVGSSIWVAIGALPALAIWVLTKPRLIPHAVVVAVLMTAAAYPSLAGYLEAGSRHGPSLSTDWPYNRFATLGRLTGPGILANWLDLPIRFVVEFGVAMYWVFLPRGVWRKFWNDNGLRWLMFGGVIAVVGITIFHSNMTYNAFGQRIIMLAMLFFALSSSQIVEGEFGRPRFWNPLGWRFRPFVPRWSIGPFVVMGTLGLSISLMEAPGSGVKRYLKGQPSAAERASYLFLRHELPADAVVQGTALAKGADLAQIARRQLGVIGPQEDVMVFDPPATGMGDYLSCYEAVSHVLQLGESSAKTHDVLSRYGITHVYLGTREATLWGSLERFEDGEFFEPLFDQDGVRILRLK